MRISPIVVALALVLPSCSKKPKPKSPADTQSEPTAAAERETEPSDVETTDEAMTEEPAEAAPELRTTYFELDSAVLSETARDKLSENARWLKQHTGEKLVIEGHTCELGTTEYNLALGERRANAARDYLRKLGVDEDRLKVVSYGEERPADPEHLEKNRRDEFVPRSTAP